MFIFSDIFLFEQGSGLLVCTVHLWNSASFSSAAHSARNDAMLDAAVRALAYVVRTYAVITIARTLIITLARTILRAPHKCEKFSQSLKSKRECNIASGAISENFATVSCVGDLYCRKFLKSGNCKIAFLRKLSLKV